MSYIRIFIQKDFGEVLGSQIVETLKEDFKNYKESNLLPDTFGRDAPYNHMNSLPIVKTEELAHIHIKENNKSWPINAIQFNRTSDTHLIYCHGSIDSNCYLLMAILSPDAHVQSRDNSIMYSLGKMAEKFREKY